MPTVYIPPLDLSSSSEEVDLIDLVIKKMTEQVNVQFDNRLERPSRINDDALSSAKIDKILELGVDEIRKAISADFVEKLYARLIHIAWYEKDDEKSSVGMLTMRLMDSIKFVISHTRKFRGAIREPLVDKDTAKKELMTRGLWKK